MNPECKTWKPTFSQRPKTSVLEQTQTNTAFALRDPQVEVNACGNMLTSASV